MVQGKLTFISGGARSGKSTYAEKILVQEAEQTYGRLVYIASGSKTDSEMMERIEKHRLDRSIFNWKTIEQPVNLEEILPQIRLGDLVLWDCVTTWLASELYLEAESMERTEVQLFETIEEVRNRASHFVIVSNEVLDEPPSLYSEVRTYSETLGRIHTELVKISTTAIEMDYGLATFWKGESGL
ncbi:bifunctional adenosylcobinamide kinase/adenosylcobinamide-phosphate guanylyltransferase [Sporosarcina sp. FA9]|uniref:bifunctional adenosylcobinamide kinase/adenosylcobinamide-phosphate guanylyltransferase n=1 Tax=Sporosarcina sp. FA9 TaxID=3413030 RepID=UPI003F65937C